jgi:hypothetical protein
MVIKQVILDKGDIMHTIYYRININDNGYTQIYSSQGASKPKPRYTDVVDAVSVKDVPKHRLLTKIYKTIKKWL